MVDRIIACWKVEPAAGSIRIICVSDEHKLARYEQSVDDVRRDPRHPDKSSHVSGWTWWNINEETYNRWNRTLHRFLDGSAGLPDWCEEGMSKYEVYEKVYGKRWGKHESSRIGDKGDEHSRMMVFFMGKKNTKGCECGAWTTGGVCSSWCPAYNK